MLRNLRQIIVCASTDTDHGISPGGITPSEMGSQAGPHLVGKADQSSAEFSILYRGREHGLFGNSAIVSTTLNKLWKYHKNSS